MATQIPEPQQSEPRERAHDAEIGLADRRLHVRFQPATHPMSGTLTDGRTVRLLDLSRGGARFECRDRLLPNATISLRLVTADGVFVVAGSVLRSRLAPIEGGGMGYVVAVAFNDTLPAFERPAGDAEPAAVTVAPAPTPMVSVTTSVDTTAGDLRRMFNGNAW